MTAPTLSEPRPDDEGRETAPREPMDDDSLAFCAGLLPKAETPDVLKTPRQREHDVAMCAMMFKPLYLEVLRLRALTPHPAPLGATDEGLEQAATRHLAEWDKPNADWSVLCETAEAIRAALQATP